MNDEVKRIYKILCKAYGITEDPEKENGYDDDDADRGCYCNGHWLSIYRIAEILDKYL